MQWDVVRDEGWEPRVAIWWPMDAFATTACLYGVFSLEISLRLWSQEKTSSFDEMPNEHCTIYLESMISFTCKFLLNVLSSSAWLVFLPSFNVLVQPMIGKLDKWFSLLRTCFGSWKQARLFKYWIRLAYLLANSLQASINYARFIEARPAVHMLYKTCCICSQTPCKPLLIILYKSPSFVPIYLHKQGRLTTYPSMIALPARCGLSIPHNTLSPPQPHLY